MAREKRAAHARALRGLEVDYASALALARELLNILRPTSSLSLYIYIYVYNMNIPCSTLAVMRNAKF